MKQLHLVLVHLSILLMIITYLYIFITLFTNNMIDCVKFKENNAGKGCNAKIKSEQIVA